MVEVVEAGRGGGGGGGGGGGREGRGVVHVQGLEKRNEHSMFAGIFFEETSLDKLRKALSALFKQEHTLFNDLRRKLANRSKELVNLNDFFFALLKKEL